MNKKSYIKPSMQTFRPDMTLQLLGPTGQGGIGDEEEMARERRNGGIFGGQEGEDETTPGMGRKLW